MAVGTQIPGTQQLYLTHDGQHAPGAHLPVTGPVSTGARYLALLRAGRSAAQQLAQRACAGPMHRSAHCHLDRFQIDGAGLALLLEDEPQQRAYFPFEFFLDRFGRFFSCGVSVSSTGRVRQIFSLVWIKVRLSS